MRAALVAGIGGGAVGVAGAAAAPGAAWRAKYSAMRWMLQPSRLRRWIVSTRSIVSSGK
jgi:hypothetical protein